MAQLLKALGALTEGSSLDPRAYDGAYNCLQLQLQGSMPFGLEGHLLHRQIHANE